MITEYDCNNPEHNNDLQSSLRTQLSLVLLSRTYPTSQEHPRRHTDGQSRGTGLRMSSHVLGHGEAHSLKIWFAGQTLTNFLPEDSERTQSSY